MLRHKKPAPWIYPHSFINWRIFSYARQKLPRVLLKSLFTLRLQEDFQQLSIISGVKQFPFVVFATHFLAVWTMPLTYALSLLFSAPLKKAQLKFNWFTLLWGSLLSFYNSGKAASLAVFKSLFFPTIVSFVFWPRCLLFFFLIFIDFFFFLEREGMEERKKYQFCCSTYLCIHWWLLTCALTGDRICKLGVYGKCSNQLNYPAGVQISRFII